MAIKVGGTTVVDDARQLTNVTGLDAATVTAFSDAGIGGGGSLELVASGSISNGDIVGLTQDGKVSVTSTYIEDGVKFTSGEASQLTSAFDSTNNKVVIAYQDRSNSNYGTAVVGTISGGSITFGTPVVFNTASTEHTGMTFDSTNDRIVIAYRDLGNADYGTAIVGTVSGTSISFGTPVVFESASVDGTTMGMAFDSTNDRVVITYRDGGNSSYGTAVVGTVSGTSISFGTPVVFNSGSTYASSATFDSANGKVVIAYRDQGNSGVGTAVVGTVSGTSISFGTPVVFEAATVGVFYGTSCTFDSTNGKVIITFSSGAGSGAVVGTVSGTSISFGPKGTFFSSYANQLSSAIDPTTGLLMATYEKNSDSRSYVSLGVVSGNSIAFTAEIKIFDDNGKSNTITFDDNAGLFVASVGFSGDSNSRVIDASSFYVANSFTGIAAEDIADGASGAVTILGGVTESLTGLTPGVTYYIQEDATLGGLQTSSKVGIALDTNKLLITSAGS